MPRWTDLLKRLVIGLEAPSGLARAPPSELSALLPHTYPIMSWRGRSVEERQLTLYKSPDYLRLLYPFSLNDNLRASYDFKTTMGMIHWLEDMDTFVADVAALHCSRGQQLQPSTLVTAMLETFVWLGAPSECYDMDAHLSGQVTWVGKSSMQVTVELTLSRPNDQEASDPPPPVAVATFLMASRSMDLSRSVAVDMIKIQTDNQKRRFDLGAEIAAMRKERRQGSFSSLEDVSSVPGSNDFLISTSSVTTDCDRNTSGSTFGGHLIRLAIEHAIAVAQAHVHSQGRVIVQLRAIEEASFLSLVPIGSSLLMKGQVIEDSKTSDDTSEIKIQITGHLSETKAIEFFCIFEILNQR